MGMTDSSDLEKIKEMKEDVYRAFKQVKGKPAIEYYNGYGEGAGTSFGMIAAGLAQAYTALLAEERAQLRQPVRPASAAAPQRALP